MQSFSAINIVSLSAQSFGQFQGGAQIEGHWLAGSSKCIRKSVGSGILHIREGDFLKSVILSPSILRNNWRIPLLYAGEPERNSRNGGVIYPVCDF